MIRYIRYLALVVAIILNNCIKAQSNTGNSEVTFEEQEYGRFWFINPGFLDFSTTPPTRISRDFFAATRRTVTGLYHPDSDIYYLTNGTTIFSQPGDTIPESDSLDYDYQTNNSISNVLAGSPNVDMAIALPGFNENEISFFHQSTRWEYVDSLNSTLAAVDSLYLTKIKTTSTFPYGEVISREEVVYIDTLDWNVSAIRHGNGRDWWLVMSSRSGRNKHNVLLYDSTGIHPLEPQYFQPNKFITGFGQSLFSPNGKYFARAKVIFDDSISKATIFLYEFDRCTGRLTNQKYFDAPIDFELARFGLSFSPNSRFLYLCQAGQVFQYDLEDDDIENSYQVLYDYRDYSEADQEAIGFPNQSRLAPDGKIYFSPLGGGNNFHLFSVSKPNLRGQAAAFLYPDSSMIFDVPLSNALPNSPPYGLGPLDGSPCDTLGISHPAPVAGFDFISTDSTTLAEFFDESSVYTTGWYWDFDDGNSDTTQYPVHNYEAPGVYYTCLTAISLNGSHTFCDSVRVGLPPVGGLFDFPDAENLALYPNPTDGFVTIPLAESGLLRVFSYDGQLVESRKLSGYQEQAHVDLSKQQAGLYMLVFLSDEGKVYRGRLVVD